MGQNQWGQSYKNLDEVAKTGGAPKPAPRSTPKYKQTAVKLQAGMGSQSQKVQAQADAALAAKRKEMAEYAENPQEEMVKPKRGRYKRATMR